jgi:hypothetical protein
LELEKAMRIPGALIVVVALASHAAHADIKRHASIPEPLQGSWAADADACKADNSKSVIKLAAKTYSSADGDCAVDWVSETPGQRGPIYSAHLRCAGKPPAKASTTNVIIRPDDAKQISVGLTFGSLKPYQKCATE